MSRINFYNAQSNYPMAKLTYDKADTLKKSRSDTNQKDEIFISAESRRRFVALKEYDPQGFLKLGEEFLQRDHLEQRKLDFSKSLLDGPDHTPGKKDIELDLVHYEFRDGTLEDLINKKLEGKANNASHLASEIAQQIRGAVSNPDATVEERAINRKTALKLSEHIAENYFDNPEEAEEFLSIIHKFAQNDEMREKGYVVIDNSDIAPFRPYTIPTAPEGYINGGAYAEKYGKGSLFEIFRDPEKLKDYTKALEKNEQKWRNEIINDFNVNQQMVESIIDKAESLSDEYIRDIISKYF